MEKRPLENSRRKWEGNIKRNLQDFGRVVDWIG